METPKIKATRGRKSTEVTYSEKITEALEMMLYEKLSAGEFNVQFAKRYNVTERTAEATWKRCKDILKQRFTEKQDEIIQEQLSRYFDLLQRARESNNRRVEREVLADMNKLYGLENRKIDITSNGQPISININLTD
jgi:transposase